MRNIFLLCFTIELTCALVDFSDSALYDIYDFKGVNKVHIAKCDSGCLIFAATMGEGFIQFPQSLDPYSMNLFITDNNGVKLTSITKLAQQRDSKNKKIPLTITGPASISVVNQNDPNTKDYFSIVLYVVNKARADESSYEVYDMYYSNDGKIISQTEIVTIMSPFAFRVQAEQTAQPKSVIARLAGFDNALVNNKDGCPYAYHTSDASSFPGFTLMSTSPILSLVIGDKNTITITLDLQFNTVFDIVPDGFITSPGWNGCTKPNNGGIQSFRSRDDFPSDMYILSSNVDYYDVTIDVAPNFDADHKLTIFQQNMLDSTPVTGKVPQQLFYANTNFLIVDFQSMKGDQGFLLRYSSPVKPKSTTKTPATVAQSSTAAVVSSTTQSPSTTSSGFRENGLILSMVLLSLLF